MRGWEGKGRVKTAMELLGKDYDARSEVISTSGLPLGRPLGQVTYQLTVEQLEAFAKRAREEMREMAAKVAETYDAGEICIGEIRVLQAEVGK